MVKTLTGIFVSLALLLGISFYEVRYVDEQFAVFEEELRVLRDKTEEETATAADGEALKRSWDEKKRYLHIWVPHNDISYIDYWLSEGVSLIGTGNYEDALSKIDVLIHISKNLPDAYGFSLENVL